MRIWFSTVPGHGHFYPLVPLARALESAGHEVAFCTSATFGDVVRSHGFTAVPVGLDYTQAGAKGEAVSPADVNRTVARTMFVDAPPRVLEDLLDLLPRERPDALLLDPWERGGPVAAEAVGVPTGAVILGIRTGTLYGQLPFDTADRERAYEEQVRAPDRRLREMAGLEPHDRWLGEGPHDRTLALDMAPPSLQTWPNAWHSHTSHALRPEVHVSGGDHSWLSDLDPDVPTVAVSLGTLFGSPELYRRAVEAALGVDVQVVAVTGLDLALEHPRLVTVRWASLDQLLPRVDAFVHHGGWGTTIAALATGTASVVVPLGSDQPVNATRVRAAGAGVTVSHERLEDELGPALRTVLDDPLYRLNARRVMGEIAAMPAAPDAVPLVERLARGEGPVMNR